MTDKEFKYFESNFYCNLIFHTVVYILLTIFIGYGFNIIYKDLIRIESKIDKIEIITNASLDIDSHIEQYVDSIEMFNYKKELNYKLQFNK